MLIADIDIERIIVHEALRASEVDRRQPMLSYDLAPLDNKGKTLVGQRLINTIASGSHCVDVTVEDGGKESPFNMAVEMLNADKEGFINNSQKLAVMLSTAQTAGPIKSGSAIFVHGDCIADGLRSRFLAIIKADSDQALHKQFDGENVTLTYIGDMLLGESQRLIKIAFIIEKEKSDANLNNTRKTENFSIKVFDHLMQNSGNGNAATYFYRTFLRCKLSQNAAWFTKIFFETAKSFVEDKFVEPEERLAYHGDIISYLRKNEAIIDPRSFARDVLHDTQLQDAFIRKCSDHGIGDAFTKDTSLVKGKLRRQSVKFSSNVTLYASSEVFQDSVKIKGLSDDGWTELKIRGSIETMP